MNAAPGASVSSAQHRREFFPCPHPSPTPSRFLGSSPQGLETLLEDLEKGFAAFEKELEEGSADDCSYAGVVERLERLRAPLEYAWGIMSHLTGVKNSDPLRNAHEELQVLLTACPEGDGEDGMLFVYGGGRWWL